MVTIIKGNKKFQFEKGDIGNIEVVYDGVAIRCPDGTEIRFNFEVKPGLASIIDMANRNVNCNDITISMDAAMFGNLSKVLTIGTPVTITQQPPKVTPEQIVQNT